MSPYERETVGGVIRRDVTEAASGSYDLIVVGGGIHGCALTLEASRRGYRALLLERSDFGGATSWNSLRVVHGGLRYLQTLDLRRFRESVGERRWLLRCFPELVEPLPCLMPLYGQGLRRRPVLRAALRANDLLSWNRNRGVGEVSRLPAGEILRPDEVRELFPGVETRSLEGGALWYDASMADAPRLLIELLRWASALGARCLNYMEARDLIMSNGAAAGVRCFDRLNGGDQEFRAPMVVNCAGPWSGGLASAFDSGSTDLRGLFRPSLAFNLLVDQEPVARVSLALTPPPQAPLNASEPGGDENVTYFLRPWRGGMLVGTRHLPRTDPSDSTPSRDELRAFLADLNRAAPTLRLAEDHIVRVYSGILPAKRAGSTHLATRDVLHLHARTGGPTGLISVVGVKYTTARSVAERTLRVLFGQGLKPSPPACEGRPALAARISLQEFLTLERDQPAEALEYVGLLQREEAAQCGEDIVLRRTDWANVPRSDPNLIRRVASSLSIPERVAVREA